MFPCKKQKNQAQEMCLLRTLYKIKNSLAISQPHHGNTKFETNQNYTFFFIDVKFNTHNKIHPLKVYNSVDLSMLTQLWGYHHSVSPEHFYHPQKKPHTY